MWNKQSEAFSKFSHRQGDEKSPPTPESELGQPARSQARHLLCIFEWPLDIRSDSLQGTIDVLVLFAYRSNVVQCTTCFLSPL